MNLSSLRLALVLGASVLGACVGSSSPSSQSSGAAPSSQSSGAASATDLRRCVTAELPYFDTGMQQARPADGRFPAGTILRLDDEASGRSGNAGVTDTTGHHAFVSGPSLAPVSAAPCAGK